MKKIINKHKKIVIITSIIILFIILFALVKILLLPTFYNITESKTIKNEGTYFLTGNVKDGKLTVKTKGKVKLYLYNLNITNSSGPAINIKKSDNVEIVLIGKTNLNSTSSDKTKGTIYSKVETTIKGSGTLNVKSLNQNGILVKNNLIIESGKINITSAKDENIVKVKEIKGIKADGVYINGGNINIDAGDDGIHTKNDIAITDGNIEISSIDDGISAGGNLIIKDGDINILKSYEGLEGHSVTIDNGNIKVKASDDGINSAIGDETIDTSSVLAINGGIVYIDCEADGLDSNGIIKITGGDIIIDGSSEGIERSLDCDGEVSITGGTIYGLECCKKYSNVSESTTQNTLVFKFQEKQTGVITVGDIKITPKKPYTSFIISSNELESNKEYKVSVDGNEIRTYTQDSTYKLIDIYQETKDAEKENK